MTALSPLADFDFLIVTRSADSPPIPSRPPQSPIIA
jgi:hypothetical protein